MGIIAGPVLLDTPPAAFTLSTTLKDVLGAALTFEYQGEPVIFEAEMNWLKSSQANQSCQLYVADPANEVRHYGQAAQCAVASRNFTASLHSPGLTELRNGSGIWTPMVVGQSYSVKLQWSFVTSATLTVGWVAESEFFGYFQVRT